MSSDKVNMRWLLLIWTIPVLSDALGSKLKHAVLLLWYSQLFRMKISVPKQYMLIYGNSVLVKQFLVKKDKLTIGIAQGAAVIVFGVLTHYLHRFVLCHLWTSLLKGKVAQYVWPKRPYSAFCLASSSLLITDLAAKSWLVAPRRICSQTFQGIMQVVA